MKPRPRTSPPSPHRLIQLGEHAMPRAAVGSLALAGDLAYIARADRVTSLDVADPSAPQLRIQHTLAGAGHLAVDDTRVCVATRDGVELLDRELARLGRVVFPKAYGVALAGDRLYVSNGDRVEVFDIADPAAPRAIAGRDVELARRLTVAGDLVLVGADCEGLVILDAGELRPLGMFDGAGDPTKVVVRDRIAFVADYSGGVNVVDLANPARPRQLADWDDGIAGDVALQGDRLFVAMGTLVVLDVAKPARPAVLAQHATSAWAVATNAAIACTLGEAGLAVWSVV